MQNGNAGTLLLSRSQVEAILTPDACLAAVEDAFRQHANDEPGLVKSLIVARDTAP